MAKNETKKDKSTAGDVSPEETGSSSAKRKSTLYDELRERKEKDKDKDKDIGGVPSPKRPTASSTRTGSGGADSDSTLYTEQRGKKKYKDDHGKKHKGHRG